MNCQFKRQIFRWWFLFLNLTAYFYVRDNLFRSWRRKLSLETSFMADHDYIHLILPVYIYIHYLQLIFVPASVWWLLGRDKVIKMIKLSELITLHKFRFAIILIKSWQWVNSVKFINKIWSLQASTPGQALQINL